jgi:hypothetical protein
VRMTASSLVRRAEVCLGNIAAKNPRVNAFVSVYPPDQVLDKVREVSGDGEPQGTNDFLLNAGLKIAVELTHRT